MSNPKLKNENYQLMGGINAKFSLYDLSPMEFLDIKNFDFQTPGAHSARWGSTQYVTQTFGSPINSIFEFSRLSGASYILVGHTGGLWFGATTGQSQGVSFSQSVSLTIGSSNFANGLGVGYIIPQTFAGTFDVRELPVSYGLSFQVQIEGQNHGDNNLSFAVLNNYMFAADGNKFFKFDGATTTYVGSMGPIRKLTPGAGPGPASGSSITGVTSTGIGFGFTGYTEVFATYVNNRGFESQMHRVGIVQGASVNGASINPLGSSLIWATYDFLTPLQYGISAINIYTYFSGTTLPINYDVNGNALETINTLSYLSSNSQKAIFLNTFPASGSTVTSVPVGTSVGNVSSVYNNIGSLNQRAFQQLGSTTIGYTGIVDSNQFAYILNLSTLDYTNYAPKFLEVYKNRLFLAGFSATPSNVWFSEVGEPEAFRTTNNFEVRTNDSDVISAMKAYATRLYLFKQGSIHTLYGDNPANYYLQEVTLNYGALNNQCVVVYEDFLLFLDRKGVMLYQGSKPECISDKVQPYFDRMNYDVALRTACMVHDKLRNQVICAIPVDGSTSNNIMMVFDYVAKAWTTYTSSFTPTVFSRIKGRYNLKAAFYGSASGTINWFGSSFLSDNGSGITTSFKSRFLDDMGNSVEKQARRLYLDADVGDTFIIPTNFYQDRGGSIVYSTTVVLGSFQQRIDFGIPCKSVAFEIVNLSTTSRLRINGFTLETRLQRRV